MSRSGYIEGDDDWETIRWRGAVASAIRGKRGQALLKELLEALDAMPVKRLIPNSFEDANGEFCTLGVLGHKRGLDMSGLIEDDEWGDCDVGAVANRFGVAGALVQEIMFENDSDFDWGNDETPEQRWQRMRDWVVKQIRGPAKDAA